MSSSTEKKIRLAEKEAGTYKKSVAKREAEQKAKKSKRNWTIGAIVVAALIIFAVVVNVVSDNSGKMTALTVNGEKVSVAELNYYTAEQFNTFYNYYGSYASIFGLDTSNGVAGLSSQECSMLEGGGTWADYFRNEAETQIKKVKALGAYATENGISLDEDQITAIEEQAANMATYATYYGYASVDAFLAVSYGNGVTTDVLIKCAKETALADKGYDYFQSTLEYTDEELEEHYQSLEGSKDIFDYAYYYLAAETVTTTAEDGTETSAPTEETLKAAEDTANEIVKAYNDAVKKAKGDVDYSQLFSDAVTASVEDASVTENSGTITSSLAYFEWMNDSARKVGDASAVVNTGNTGYYIALYLGRDDNHYNTVSVRHILVKAVADENGEYTEEAMNTAKAAIEDIEKVYLAGDKTEESFIALVEEYSEDEGSNQLGGLYEDIYHGEMVEEFNDFCFADHKAGDIAIVKGESSSYAGYHLVYFVGEGDLYSNVLAKSDLVTNATSEWINGLIENYTVEHASGYRYAQ